jgi:hypothetical protein
MVIAGTSEFLLIASLIFAAIKAPKLKPRLKLIYLVALTSTFFAATMGVFRYLELADTVALHSGFSFASKHLGMALFIGITLLAATSKSGENHPIIALIGISIVSLIINSFASLVILSDAVIILLLAYGIYLQRNRPNIFIQLVLATLILLSTLVWGVIIHNPDIRLGVFHLCLSLFIFIFTVSMNTKLNKAPSDEDSLQESDTECA